MHLPTTPLIFVQSFSKNSQETEFPFGGDFGGLRVEDCTIGDCMEVGPSHEKREIPFYDDFCRVAITIPKHNLPSNLRPDSPQASR